MLAINLKRGTITSLEKLMISESGMRGREEFEILPDGQNAKIRHYGIFYRQGEEQKELLRQCDCEMSEVLSFLNECRLLTWNGFHGAHPKNVSDGIMFTMEALVNGDRIVKADGSANFPRHYHELMRWISEKLSQNREEH
ncbi:MAG: hypothetical protein IJM79_06185 [Erysipelotrichaceae bacterium]|nr:hypothetical protein [Erysipelotrichaceae bacterium]